MCHVQCQCSSRTGTGRNIAFWAQSIVTDMLFSDGTEGGLAAEKTALMLADTCRCLLVLIASAIDQGRLSWRLRRVQKQAPDHFIEFSPSPSRLIRPPALSKSVSIDNSMDIGRAAKTHWRYQKLLVIEMEGQEDRISRQL
ncbi:hypothetical protein Trisim1_012480 [Trichoderma cf. simile WF8]